VSAQDLAESLVKRILRPTPFIPGHESGNLHSVAASGRHRRPSLDDILTKQRSRSGVNLIVAIHTESYCPARPLTTSGREPDPKRSVSAERSAETAVEAKAGIIKIQGWLPAVVNRCFLGAGEEEWLGAGLRHRSPPAVRGRARPRCPVDDRSRIHLHPPPQLICRTTRQACLRSIGPSTSIMASKWIYVLAPLPPWRRQGVLEACRFQPF
jgi:hypothetical protein